MHESEKCKWSCLVVSDSSRPHGLQPTRLLRPWDFPNKSTGVGCHWATQIWTINDHSGYRAMRDVLCWLSPTLHGDTLAVGLSKNVSDPLADITSFILRSVVNKWFTTYKWTLYFQKGTHFSHYILFIFQVFKTAIHKHTPRIKNIQDPSTLSSVHLVWFTYSANIN